MDENVYIHAPFAGTNSIKTTTLSSVLQIAPVCVQTSIESKAKALVFIFDPRNISVSYL